MRLYTWCLYVGNCFRQWEYSVCFIGEGCEMLWRASGTVFLPFPDCIEKVDAWLFVLLLELFYYDIFVLFFLEFFLDYVNAKGFIFISLKGTSWKPLESYSYNKEEINQVETNHSWFGIQKLVSELVVCDFSICRWVELGFLLLVIVRTFLKPATIFTLYPGCL